MRRASSTWRVKTAVQSYGVTYSLSLRATVKCLSLHGTPAYVCACLSAVPARRCGIHARRRREGSFVAQPSQRARVVTESDVRRSAESHRHERRNLRSHHPCMQMPRSWEILLSLSLSILSSNPPLTRGKKRKMGGELGRLAHTDLPRSRAFIGLPHYFTTDSGLKGLNAVRMENRVI